MKLLAALGVALGLTFGASQASAQVTKQRTYIQIDNPTSIESPEPGDDFVPPSRILFVNWCDGNCVITRASNRIDDSRTNKSSIVSGTPVSRASAIR